MQAQVPADWRRVLSEEFSKPYFQELAQFVADERAAHDVFPEQDHVFQALKLTPFDQVRVVLLGQDPYHDVGQAHGLAFSVRPGVKLPPSLRNIFKELHDDLGIARPPHGCLSAWAERGVLLLNTILTVRAHKAGSHRNHGWEVFTDAILRAIGERKSPAAFLLWGSHAQAKKPLIDLDRHAVLESPHPSPLSASKGFFGSKPFSWCNRTLTDWGQGEIDWHLPAEVPNP